MKHLIPMSIGNPPGKRGITLIELIVVMVIIAVLASLSLPALSEARKAARKTQCQNNLRNIALGLVFFDQTNARLPASGSFGHDQNLKNYSLHSWAVHILPFVEQSNIYDRLELDLPPKDPKNKILRTAHIPLYLCPIDITRNEQKYGDLSYAVNGGVGFTVFRLGVRDCPVDQFWTVLDLNGDGQGCTGTDADQLDKDYFKKMGLFFLETRNTSITIRHYSIDDILDGASQTFLVTENVRTGYDPTRAFSNFADSNPYKCAFYIGNPCRDGNCSPGNVDYSLSNQGDNRINSGLWKPEGDSPVPNSFHLGGVNMAFCDGRVMFLSENIDGRVYAALASPLGMQLNETPLAQPLLSDTSY